jgi:hypothetical protein
LEGARRSVLTWLPLGTVLLASILIVFGLQPAVIIVVVVLTLVVANVWLLFSLRAVAGATARSETRRRDAYVFNSQVLLAAFIGAFSLYLSSLDPDTSVAMYLAGFVAFVALDVCANFILAKLLRQPFSWRYGGVRTNETHSSTDEHR